MAHKGLPLSGMRIVVTRPAHQMDAFRTSIEGLGATVIPFPTIKITPVEDFTILDHALAHLDQFDWLLFTSVNGVRIALMRLGEKASACLRAGAPRLAAIGPATADALQPLGPPSVFVPPEYVGESLADALPDVEGRRILLLRTCTARPTLPERLSARGADVEEVSIYRTIRANPSPEQLQELRAGVTAVTFTSPSTVQNWVSILGEHGLAPFDLPGSPVFACIGPVTAQAASEAGCPSSLTAESYTTQGLMDCLLDYFSNQEG